ncbi:hypothetical protein [Rhizobium leguminosarum]|uniref:hypothetical protein n=1 Tax=Rhizobium leguminosarum TaxID=384 RepID=UPI0003667A20|nr:hypothetical protein [Rhizobium leguminosarum]
MEQLEAGLERWLIETVAEKLRNRGPREHVSLLRGVNVIMKDGSHAELVAQHSQSDRVLGVKLVLTAYELVKPISERVFVFHTGLLAHEHCDPALLVEETWQGKRLKVRQDVLLAMPESKRSRTKGRARLL